MTDSNEIVTQETLQRLVGRAIELAEKETDGVTLERAREIALELGISSTAWDAAVLEFRRTADRHVVTRRSGGLSRLVMMAALGLVAGSAAAVIGESTGDVTAGAVLVAWSVAFAIRARGAVTPRVLAQLAAWWAAVPVGIMWMHGEVLADPLWFAAFSWIGSAALTKFLPSLRNPKGPPSTA